MRRGSLILPLLGLLILLPGLRAADEKKAEAKPSDKAFTFPKQVVYVALQEGIRFWTVEPNGGLAARQGAFADWASLVKGLPK